MIGATLTKNLAKLVKFTHRILDRLFIFWSEWKARQGLEMSYYATSKHRSYGHKQSKSVTSETKIDLAMRGISSYITELADIQIFVEKQLSLNSVIMTLLRTIRTLEHQLMNLQNHCNDEEKYNSRYIPVYLAYLYSRIVWYINEFGVAFRFETSNKVPKITFCHETNKYDCSTLLINIFGMGYEIMTAYLNAITDPGCSPRESNTIGNERRSELFIEFINSLSDLFEQFLKKEQSIESMSISQDESNNSRALSFGTFQDFAAFMEGQNISLCLNHTMHPTAIDNASSFAVASRNHEPPSVILQAMVVQTLEHVMDAIYEERAYQKGVLYFLKTLHNPEVLEENRALYMGKVTGLIDEFTGGKKVTQMMLRLKAELSEKEKWLRRKVERRCSCRCFLHILHDAGLDEAAP